MSSSSGSETTAKKPKVIIFGVGNTFYGDDGIGYCLAKALRECATTENAEIVAVQTLNPGHSAFLEGYDYVVFIDAYYEQEMPKDANIVVLELDPTKLDENDLVLAIDSIEPHSLDPLKLLVLARAANIFNGKGYLIGIRPERIDFNKPVTEETLKRGIGAIKKLNAVITRIGVAMTVNENCIARFLHETCKGPLLD